MSPVTVLALAALAGFFLIKLYLRWKRVAHSLGDLSGETTLLEPMTPLSQFLPHIPLLAKGGTQELDTGYADFAASGCDAYAHTHLWSGPGATLYLADPDAIKEVTTHRSRFPKPLWLYEPLLLFGRNLVASEGEQWKRYRKISAPAFSESNNKLVWDEATRIVLDLVENVWNRADVVTVDHFLEVTLPMSLFTISAAGFGRRLSFTGELEGTSPGFEMNFKDALQTVCEGLLTKLAVPTPLFGVSKRYRTINTGFNELQKHMAQLIYSRKQSGAKTERHDLFSNLLDAANDELDDKRKLGDSELMGNIFIFLFAGHETAAHTLAFAFALLALCPDKQERLLNEIKAVSSDLSGPPGHEDMPRFGYALAIFYETLRIRPSVAVIPKFSAEDTTLNVKDAEGRTKTIPIPKGTNVNIHVAGLHDNRPRACVGRRFAETEAVAILVALLSRYRVRVKDDPQYSGETHEQRRARLLKWTIGITTTPVHVPLSFERRM